MAPVSSSSSKVTCPSCSKQVSYPLLNEHLDQCLSTDQDQEAHGGEAHDRKIEGDGVQHSDSNPSQSEPRNQYSASTISDQEFSGNESALEKPDSSLGLKRVVNDSMSSTHSNKKQKQESSAHFTSASPKPAAASSSKMSGFQVSPASTIPTFGTARTSKARLQQAAPLAERLRPTSLDEFIGQEQVTDGPLKAMLSKGLIPSCLLWGPPGTGKTTLARLLTKTASEAISRSDPQTPPMKFIELSATTATTTEIKKVFDESVNRISLNGQKTVLFLDEIQRFNRAQQDIFLPVLEKGHIILIGATTENPSFRLQGALLSRTRVFILNKLSVDSCFAILKTARRKASEIGLGRAEEKDGLVEVSDDILRWISTMCDGDARSALSTLELALVTLQKSNSSPNERLAELKTALKRTSLNYDRSGDMHYDTISALHKSIRGSDADAAMYWLARMIASGDDPLYVARRLMIAASEDVGTPEALQLATSTYYAVSIIGLPEAAEPLSQAVLYLAEAKKSTRAYRALQKATKLVNEGFNFPVPIHIRNAPTKLMKEIGYGREYRYEPSFAHPIYQPFLPPELKGTRFVSPPLQDEVNEHEDEEGAPVGSEDETEAEDSEHKVKVKDKVGAHGNSKSKVKGKYKAAESLDIRSRVLGLTPENGTGPGSCQRVFEIGARAVDLDLLEEWESERNGGRRWEGREGLMEAIRRKEGEQV